MYWQLHNHANDTNRIYVLLEPKNVLEAESPLLTSCSLLLKDETNGGAESS